MCSYLGRPGQVLAFGKGKRRAAGDRSTFTSHRYSQGGRCGKSLRHDFHKQEALNIHLFLSSCRSRS